MAFAYWRNICTWPDDNERKNMNWIFIKSTAKGKEEYGSISARVRTQGQNRKYAIGFRIKRSEWDRIRTQQYALGEVMASIDMPYSQFASLLTAIKAAIENNEPEPQRIPALIQEAKALARNVSATPRSEMLLTDYISHYRDDLKSGRRLKRKKSVRMSDGYIGNITSVLNHLRRYEISTRQRVRLDQVDMRFQRSFVAFMTGLGLQPNTIHTRMNIIRSLMEAACRDKLTASDAFRNPDFVPEQEESDSIWLTPEQIEHLRLMDLSSTKAVKAHCKKARMRTFPRIDMKLVRYLAYARDIFVVGCLTGQRYSDYIRLSSGMVVKIDGSEFIALRQQKTGRKVLIPMDARVAEILERHGGRLPNVSKLTYSRHIKLLAELMGWTYLPEFDRAHGNRSKSRFCDMVTTHTCRRSFATNAYAAGVPLSSIMAVTGHSSEKSLRRYLKLQAEDKALIAARDFEGFILEAPPKSRHGNLAPQAPVLPHVPDTPPAHLAINSDPMGRKTCHRRMADDAQKHKNRQWTITL